MSSPSRQCWVLQDTPHASEATAAAWLNNLPVAHRLAWLAPARPAKLPENTTYLSAKQSRTMLGKTTDVVVFDARDECNADALGIVGGTIAAGGVLLILWPEATTRWAQRFERILRQSAIWFQAGDTLPALTSIAPINHNKPTADQVAAITEIKQVAQGHRHRPLILTADRGRGKSAALGMAAAQLMRAEQKIIAITAPNLAAVEAAFQHAQLALPDATMTRGKLCWQSAELVFVAADIAHAAICDLLLVDEAAAIPAPMLWRYAEAQARIVFATTVHGYEGAGRGFAVRFQQQLTAAYPRGKQITLSQPIRHAENDPLEQLLFDALLLNAEVAAPDTAQDFSLNDVHIKQLDRAELLADETRLRSLFGLMVTAHYRTRPVDLQQLLDAPDMTVWVAEWHGCIIASAWLVEEGGINPELAAAVHGGTRRLKGHLLPQTLINHAADFDAGGLRYRRVIRLAVQPYLHGCGVGSAVMDAVTSAAQKAGIDAIGVSFGATVELVTFWQQAGMQWLRLGIKKSDTSGYHAAVMMQGLTDAGKRTVITARERLAEQWGWQLNHIFPHLPAELVRVLSVDSPQTSATISPTDQADITAFYQSQRSFEASHYSLSKELLSALQTVSISAEQHTALVMAIIENQPLITVAKACGCTGKAQVLALLRDAVRQVWEQKSD